MNTINTLNFTTPSHCDAPFGPIVSPKCRPFDFTLTFTHSILIILPSSLFLLLAPLRLVHLSGQPIRVAGPHLRRLKQTSIGILAALQLVLVVLWANSRLSGVPVSLAVSSACVSFAASLMCCVLSYFEHARSSSPSTLLNIFLLISLLLDAVLLRSLWLVRLSQSIRAVFSASFAAKTLLLVVEAVDKSRYLLRPGYSPEETAGVYSRAVFAWVTPLLIVGWRRLLKPVDMFVLDEDMAVKGLNQRFWWNWNHAPASKNHRLIKVCTKTLLPSLLAIILPRLLLLAFTICQPLILNRFLIFLANESQSVSIGYGLIGAYGLVYFGIAVSQALYWHRNGRSVTMLRGMLVSAIFEKSTRLRIGTSDDAAAVTLMSSDVEVIVRAIKEIHEFWANTIQIGIATWLLSIQIGYAAAGPIIVAVVALMSTIFVSPLAKDSQMAWLSNTQKRVGITSAMIGHIKSIKMSGLAHTLSQTLTTLRASEISSSRPFRIINCITSSIAQVPMLLSPVVAFALFQGVAATTGQMLDATRLFAALSLVILLAQPLFWMFEVVLDMSAAFGAFERIDRFLAGEERTDYRRISLPSVAHASQGHSHGDIEMQNLRPTSPSLTPEPQIASHIAVEVQGASFGWSDEHTILEDINFKVHRGQLTLLLGPVASGKSTLLKGLLGEVSHMTGIVSLSSDHLSWSEQSPWLLNQTIRDNIIGYSHFDPDLYTQVVKACDLEKDLRQLFLGDMTMVGSKGLALSGGQKQRVALARAVYSRPRIGLFDDVFSGLDSRTAQRVFKNLFSATGLLRQWGTTVILATQSVSFLPSADHLIFLDRGHISQQGSFDDLRHASTYLQSLRIDTTLISSLTPEDDEDDFAPGKPTLDPAHEEQADPRRQLGDSTVYKYYFRSIGPYFLITLLALEITWAFLESFPTVWLKFWADENSKHAGNHRPGYYLGVYATLQIVAVAWFAVLIWFVLVLVAAKSGISLHQRLLATVMRAPLSVFTTTDLGSIATRFSQDIGMVDNHLPLALVVTLASFFTLLAKAALLALSSPYIAIVFPFIGILYFYLQRGYLRTSRQLRLLDLEEKAPVYTQFLETLSGLATLRAFRWQQHAIEKSQALADGSQRPFYLLIMVQRWLVLVLDLTTTALALLIVSLAVRLLGSVSIGLTGVSLVQLISLSETMNMLIQFWTSIETSIGAVARIKQFAEETGNENLPGERGEPPMAWPSRGEVVIRDFSASYGEDGVRALDGISLSIRPGAKLGICGRTGSGKSSLLLALLRLLDPLSGSITVDGIPLTSLPRETIRTRLIAITQDHFILPGNIRQNLDPTSQTPDDTLTHALSLVGLWEAIQQRGGLDATLEEEMLSHGQRQLFFLARAVVKRGVGKVVLLDEATSSVDQKTEAMVKTVIDSQFRDYTVISIAHRLDAIMGFDRVVVMENGCIVEAGEPEELLGRMSKFKTLWDASYTATEE